MEDIKINDPVTLKVIYGEFEGESGYRWRFKDGSDQTLGFSTVIHMAKLDGLKTLVKMRDALNHYLQDEGVEGLQIKAL